MSRSIPPDPAPERKVLSLCTTTTANLCSYLLSKFSSLRKIQGAIAYFIRFIHYLQKRDVSSSYLTSDELQHALHILVKHVQADVFAKDIQNLRQNKTCPKPLRKLAPFLDSEGIMTVGGRLQYSELSFNIKHPILLPRKHRLVQLIIESFHAKYMHPGPNGLLHLLMQQFCILSARRAIQHYTSHCLICFRKTPVAYNPPVMSGLPPHADSRGQTFHSYRH